MNEDKASRYHRLKRTISVVSLGWGVALLVLLLATGGSLALRRAAARVLQRLRPGAAVRPVERDARRVGPRSGEVVRPGRRARRRRGAGDLLVHRRRRRSLVARRRSDLRGAGDRPGDARSRRAASALLFDQAALARGSPRAAVAARRARGRARARRVRVGAWREDEEGERGADGHRRDAPHPGVRQLASRVHRRRYRGGARARAGAPRPRRPLEGDRVRERVDSRRVLFGIARPAGIRRAARSERPGGRRGSAAAAAGRRRRVAGDGPVRARDVARLRAPRGSLRAGPDAEPVGVHLGDEASRRAEPGRGAAVEAGAAAVLQPSSAARADRGGADVPVRRFSGSRGSPGSRVLGVLWFYGVLGVLSVLGFWVLWFYGFSGSTGSRVLRVLGFDGFSGSRVLRVRRVLGFYGFSGSTGSRV